MQSFMTKLTNVKNIPGKIMLFGFIVSVMLLIKAMIVSSAQFSYENFILCEFLFDDSVFVFIECTIAAILFSYLENKKKREENV